MSVVAATLWS